MQESLLNLTVAELQINSITGRLAKRSSTTPS